jgi:hypothetical protein
MLSPRRPSALLAAAALLGLSASADAATTAWYAGRTSQRQPIVFAISGGQVIHLSFRINARCRNGRIQRIAAHGFHRFPIAGGRFDQHFRAKAVTAVVKGKVTRRRGTGSVAVTGRVSGLSCSGKATFAVGRQSHRSTP